ncbi:MAG: DUF4381 domain-containing protein [Xanthomonadales bacterium]|nr:DUF4381 domain-containing protein [Xanthomonadales bacterium]
MQGPAPDVAGPVLRPLQLPAEPGWFPPAPGWWLLALLTLLLLSWLWWQWRRRQARRWQGGAPRRLLRQLRTDPLRVQQPQRWLGELSALLRRAALQVDARCAGLQGQAWAAWLDARLGRAEFATGAGQVLLAGPYQRHSEFDADALLALCEELLQRLEQSRGGRA